MASFQGICSMPHGLETTGFLWMSLAAATICSCYSIASCRMLTLQFESNLGDFDSHFVEFDPADTAQQYQVGIGLFTWLRPSFYVDGDDDTVTRATVGNWREGTCAGYNTLQLEQIMDQWLESTRILGVFTVLISWSVFLFSLMVSCVALANWQRYLLTASCLFLAVINGLTLLMTNSQLCTQMGTEPGTSVCAFDQGALVAIAAVILWVCSALLSFFFLEPIGAARAAAVAKAKGIAPPRRNKALDKQRKANKTDWNNSSSSSSKKKNNTTTPNSKRTGKKESPATPNTVYSSCSIPSPKHAEPHVPTSANSKKNPNKAAVVAKAILHDDPPTRKSLRQKIFGEKKDSRAYREDHDSDYDVESRGGIVPPSQNPAYRYKTNTRHNPVKDYVQEVLRNPSDPTKNKRGYTAGEILIDLRSAAGNPKQQPQQPRPRTIPKTKSREGSVLEDLQRQVLFTDIKGSSSSSSHRGTTAAGRPKQDLALQQQSSSSFKNPFAACDPGCWN